MYKQKVRIYMGNLAITIWKLGSITICMDERKSNTYVNEPNDMATFKYHNIYNKDELLYTGLTEG